jgi:isopenicillin N synthase-like dioxygenase
LESVDKPIRIGEHTDFGLVTFLLLGDHGADCLQIKPIKGSEVVGDAGGKLEAWLDVVTPASGTIVNTGALLSQWTNDEWMTTAHRAAASSKEVASRERF